MWAIEFSVWLYKRIWRWGQFGVINTTVDDVLCHREFCIIASSAWWNTWTIVCGICMFCPSGWSWLQNAVKSVCDCWTLIYYSVTVMLLLWRVKWLWWRRFWELYQGFWDYPLRPSWRGCNKFFGQVLRYQNWRSFSLRCKGLELYCRSLVTRLWEAFLDLLSWNSVFLVCLIF